MGENSAKQQRFNEGDEAPLNFFSNYLRLPKLHICFRTIKHCELCNAILSSHQRIKIVMFERASKGKNSREIDFEE